MISLPKSKKSLTNSDFTHKATLIFFANLSNGIFRRIIYHGEGAYSYLKRTAKPSFLHGYCQIKLKNKNVTIKDPS